MAERYWTGNATPTSNNWNYNSGGITNWGSASGVADNVAPPTSTDDVIFDGAGAKGNVNSTISANITILSLTFTSGYTGTVIENITVILTVGGNFTDNTAHNWTINSTNTGALTISSASTITSNGKIFPGNVTFSGSNTKTLNGDWTITGQLTIPAGSTTTLNQTGTDTLSINGLTQSETVTGTATIRFTGGAWTSGRFLGCNVNLDGNVAIQGGSFGNKTLKYISGTITNPGTLFLTTCTLDTNPVIFNNIQIDSGNYTVTLNSLFKCQTLTLATGTKTFDGIAGFEVNTITSTAASTTTLKNGITYTINSNITITNGLTITSDNATLKAIVILKNVANCNTNCNFTRIDASGGRIINTWNGTVTDCVNIRRFTDLQTVASSTII